MLTHEEAAALLEKHIAADALLRHVWAVEACMRGYARRRGEDVELWGLVGLLHDLDYEETPDEHPHRGAAILADVGFPDDFVAAVRAHGDPTVPRTTAMAKTLYAVDELSSFIIACVLVRPDKDFSSLKVRSVTKKLKDKAFARRVDRNIVKQGAEELGVPLPEHIAFLIECLKEREEELQQEGLSLVS